MDKFADDGTGPNDGGFDHEIVKFFRLHARQRRLLGTALDLKKPDGVGALQHFENRRIILGNVREIDGTPAFFAEGERIFDGGEHAEAEEVDFDEAEVFAIVLVPLDNDAAGHGGRFERDVMIEAVIANNHAAAVLAEMPWQSERGHKKLNEGVAARVVFRQAGEPEMLAHFEGVRMIAMPMQVGKSPADVLRNAENFSHVAHRAAATVSDDVGGHGGAVRREAPVNFLDHALTLVAAGEIDVDVRPGVAAVAQKALEKQAAADGIDVGDAEGKADR
jgi:hypothetical protein